MIAALLLVGGVAVLTGWPLVGWWRRRQHIPTISEHWMREHLYGCGKDGH